MKRILSTLVMLLALATGVHAQSDEPIITFHTTLYDEDGADNAFTLVFGATEEETVVSINSGYGSEDIDVGMAYIEGDSTLTGTTYTGCVSKNGTVKIYGDASKIDYFNASGCCITDIEFSPELNLQILNLEYNTLTALDIDHMTNLQALYLTDNPFTKDTPLNLGYLPNLALLDIHQVGHVSPDFDLKNFPSLISFDAYHCLTLKKADTSACPNLVRLTLDMTAVEDIDPTNNPYLSILNVSDTRVRSLDLTKCPQLMQLYCSHGSGSINTDVKLDALDVTCCPNLYVLFCGGNNIKSLDVSQNAELFDLSAPDNQLTEIDLSGCPELYNVNLRGNKMDFATLPLPENTWSTYYYDQQEFPLNDTFKVGDVIDLSSRVLRDGTETTAVLYSVPKDCPTDATELDSSYYTYEDGKVTLLKACDNQVFIAYSNSSFSEYDMYTEKFRIKTAEDFGKDELALSLGSTETEGSDIKMTVGIKDATTENPVTVSVDFGDGTLQTFAVTEEIPSSSNITATRTGNGYIQVYVPQDHYMSAFESDGLSITNIDLTNLTELRKLKIRNAGLTAVDLSYNTNLENLDLSGNSLSSVSLKGQTYYFYKGKLHDINLSNNKLTEFTFDDLYAAENLNLSNNQLEELDVSDADNLLSADMSGNKFEYLVFSNSDSLRYLNAANNNLTHAYVPEDAPLNYIDISGNKFTFADMDTLLVDYSKAEQFVYAPQQAIQIAQKSPSIDLSSQYYNVNGNETQFVWRKADGTALVEDEDYSITKGATKFLNTTVGDVYCEMTHAAYPQFSGENALKTTVVTPIVTPTVELASFTTTETGNTVELSLAAEKEHTSLFIDWEGNGEVTEYDLTTTYTRFDATTKANANVRVLVADKADKISVFSITGAKMKDLDLSGLTGAFAITIADAGLTEFNMPKSNAIGELNLSGNSLSSLDLSKYPNLYYISLNGNKFTDIDLSKAEGLGLAYLGNNSLSHITLGNPNLWNLDLGSNNFTEVSFEGAPNIEQMWLTDNQLTTVDLDGLNSLRVINLVGNKFRFSTLPVQKDKWVVYSYGNQADIEVAANQYVIDLSSEAAVGDSITTYRWFIGTPTIDEDTEELVGDELVADQDYCVVNGVTTFNLANDTDDIVGVLTNPQFPNLTLYTKSTTIVANGIEDINEGTGEIDAVYAPDGKMVGRNLKSLSPGIYIVKSGNNIRKVTVK